MNAAIMRRTSECQLHESMRVAPTSSSRLALHIHGRPELLMHFVDQSLLERCLKNNVIRSHRYQARLRIGCRTFVSLEVVVSGTEEQIADSCAATKQRFLCGYT